MPFPRLPPRLAAAGLVLLCAAPAAAQRHARTDSLIARSPLGTIVPLPAPGPSDGLAALPRGAIHLQLSGGSSTDAEGPATATVAYDTERYGVSAGFRTESFRGTEPSLGTVGARLSPGMLVRRIPQGDVVARVDVVAGFTDVDAFSTGSLGFRLPVQLTRGTGPVRLALLGAPAMGWGRVRVRECRDDGPGDNCGDLGVQLDLGRTRFMLGGGAGIAFVPRRVVVSAGAQRVLAAGQGIRLALGATVGW